MEKIFKPVNRRGRTRKISWECHNQPDLLNLENKTTRINLWDAIRIWRNEKRWQIKGQTAKQTPEYHLYYHDPKFQTVKQMSNAERIWNPPNRTLLSSAFTANSKSFINKFSFVAHFSCLHTLTKELKSILKETKICFTTEEIK